MATEDPERMVDEPLDDDAPPEPELGPDPEVPEADLLDQHRAIDLDEGDELR